VDGRFQNYWYCGETAKVGWTAGYPPFYFGVENEHSGFAQVAEEADLTAGPPQYLMIEKSAPALKRGR
jgi:hypothetical protein